MPPSPDRELLTQTAARELLERAGQIDSDSTSVETLRAAAREAGISDAAFEAALVEIRGKMARQPSPEPLRRRNRLFVPIAAVAIGAAVAFYIMPRAVGSSPSAMIDHEFIVKCLPMRTAQDIAQTTLRDPGNEIQMSQGSRILRLRATDAQMKILQARLDATAKGLATCDNTPAGR